MLQEEGSDGASFCCEDDDNRTEEDRMRESWYVRLEENCAVHMEVSNVDKSYAKYSSNFALRGNAAKYE